MALNIKEASPWRSLSVGKAADDAVTLVKDNFPTWLLRKVLPFYDKRCIENVTECVSRHFSALAAEQDPQKLKDAITFGDRFIKKFKKSKHVSHDDLLAFDHRLGNLKRLFSGTVNERCYALKENSTNFRRWKRYGFDPDIYFRYPNFIAFAFKSKLASQMKATRDVPIIEDKGTANEALYITVEGKKTSSAAVLERFDIQYSPIFRHDFIVERATNAVFYYLDSGNGLVKHHPYKDILSTPTSVLDEDAYKKTVAKAREFVRPLEHAMKETDRSQKNMQRTHIIQIVTSRKNLHGNFLTDNALELFKRPRHAYLRFIAGEDSEAMEVKKGDVFSIGYGFWNAPPKLPFQTIKGAFKSPDDSEYIPYDERVVTNIAISTEEAKRFRDFTLSYHNGTTQIGHGIAFHMTQQNCSVYINKVLAQLSLGDTTKIYLRDVIARIVPSFIKNAHRKTMRALKKTISPLSYTYHAITPTAIQSLLHRSVDKSRGVWNTFLALNLSSLRLIGGGSLGRGGKKFSEGKESGGVMAPPLKDIKNFFDLASYNYNLPGILQEWQRKQPSTVVYDKPQKLSIVPPESE